MNWLIRFVKGIVISLGFILPGVSGGVLASILGLYGRMLSFLAHVTKDFKNNFFFFLPVGLGGIAGLVLLSAPLEFLLNHFQIIVLWGFAGAIFGSLPSLMQEAYQTKSGRLRKSSPREFRLLLMSLVLSALILYFLPFIGLQLPNNFFGFIIAGVLIALGVLVPGLSPSNLLLILGIFLPMLNGFRERNILGVFLPIIIGAVLAILLFSRFFEGLLEKRPRDLYHIIIGLVLASTILILIPSHGSESIQYSGMGLLTFLLALVFAALGFALGLWMSKLEDKYKVEA